MHLERLLLVLMIFSVLAFSCKTTDDAPAGDAAPAALTEDSAPAEEVEVADETAEVPVETVVDEPVKETGKSGGVKSAEPVAPEAVDSVENIPEITDADPADANAEPAEEVAAVEEPAVEMTAVENPEPDTGAEVPAVEPAPETEEPPRDAAAVEDEDVSPAPVVVVEEAAPSEVPSVVVSERAALPSENDNVPSNPLLPIVIQGDSNTVEPPAEPTALSEPPAQAEPVIPEPITEDEYSLSTDPSGKLVVSLDGSGWVFLSGGEDSAYTLYEKYYDPESGETHFTFRVDNSGNFDSQLQFMKQDILRGESEERSLSLDRDLYLSLNDGLKSEEGEAAGEDSPAAADSGEISDSEPGDIATDNSDPFLELMNPESPLEAELEAEPVQELPVNPSPVYTEEDLAGMSAADLYELARLYESPGQHQSLEKARELYLRIRSTYPVTEERFMAEDRIRYLDRYYFKVQ